MIPVEQKDINEIKKGYQDLGKKKNVDNIIKNINNISTQEEMFSNFMKYKNEFLSYFNIYQKMDQILKKYENNTKFVEILKEDHYQKIAKKINLLNEINIIKVYNYIKSNSTDRENEDIGLNVNESQDEDNQIQDQKMNQELINNQEYLKERDKRITKNSSNSSTTQRLY